MEKIIKSIVLLIAAVFALTACKAELKESLESPHEIVFSAGEVEDPVGDEAEDTDGIETRTVFGTASGTSVPTLWTSNQNVDIFYSGKGGVQKSELSVTPSSNGKTAKFFGTVKPASGTGFVLLSPAACYSSHSNTSASVVVPTTQTPTSASPDEKAMILGDATGKYVSLPTTVKFSPKHMTSYIALTLKNTLSAGKTPTVTLTATVPISGNAVFDYSGTTPTLKAASSGSSNSITVKPTGLSGIWFACIPARVSGKKLTISVTGSAGKLTREITVPTGKNLLPGNIATLTVDMNPSTTVPVTGVSLNKTSLTLDAGKSETLTATVTPSNATDKSVTWSSSNTAVATVSSEGVVTGVKAGTATITVTTNDGGKTATCAVTVNTSVVQLEAVDLGLSVKWANKNVGSDRPENVGDYISWGETAPKENYAWDTYKWGQSTSHLTKYVWRATFGTVDNRNVLLPDDDAATVNLGGKWRLPTRKEAQELISQCTYVEKNLNGVSGYEFTGKNGKTLFFPITCMMIGSGLADESETTAQFWLKDLNVSNNNSWGASFGCHATNRFIAWTNRYIGLTVRAVDGSNDIAVSSITLNKSSLSLDVSGTETLTATVAPSTATIPDVVWSSSNTSVATVDYTGKVTALKAGTAVIKASSYDGAKTASCNLTVKSVKATKVEILTKGSPLYEDGMLHITSNHSAAFNYRITYSDGTVVNDAEGEVTIVSGSSVSIQNKAFKILSYPASASGASNCRTTIRVTSTKTSSVYDEIVVQTWANPTGIDTWSTYSFDKWLKEGTTQTYPAYQVLPAGARQKVKVSAPSNDKWTLTQTGDLSFTLKAPMVNGTTVAAYQNQATTVKISPWHTTNSDVSLTQTFHVSNIEVREPKLFDVVAYNSNSKKNKVFDGGLRIFLKTSTARDYEVKEFYCEDVSLYVPNTGYKVVGIVTTTFTGTESDQPVTGAFKNTSQLNGLIGPDDNIINGNRIHGFAIAMYNAVASYWSRNKRAVQLANGGWWPIEINAYNSTSDCCYLFYGNSSYSNMLQGYTLTACGAYYNGQITSSDYCIYPVDRVWRYGEPGIEYSLNVLPKSYPNATPTSGNACSFVMRPWFVPTINNWSNIMVGGKLYNTAVMDKINAQITKVGFGDKVFPYSSDRYWTINTVPGWNGDEPQAYEVYANGFGPQEKTTESGVRPFMIF